MPVTQAQTSNFDPLQQTHHHQTPDSNPRPPTGCDLALRVPCLESSRGSPSERPSQATEGHLPSGLAGAGQKQLLVKDILAEQSHSLAQGLVALLHANHRSLDASETTLGGFLDTYPQKPAQLHAHGLASISGSARRSLPGSPLRIPNYRNLQFAEGGCLGLLRSLDQHSSKRLKNLSDLLHLADQHRRTSAPHDLLEMVALPPTSNFYRSVNYD